MGLLAKDKGGSNIPPCPTGMHHGICYGVVDVGTQPAFGKFPARRKVVVLFEFPELRIDLPDKNNNSQMVNLPRALSIKETLTLSSKGNLRKILEGWRGRPFTEKELEGFDMKNLISANALCNVIHETKEQKTYANIATINPLAKGMKKAKNETPDLFFSFDDLPKTGAIKFPPQMPEWVQGLIRQSEEWQARTGQGHQQQPHEEEERQTENLDEDVPF
jgi:hypothetical protein